ncbi:MAG: hypothetical protein AAF657_04865 [Acidobacteriota bacterium]
MSLAAEIRAWLRDSDVDPSSEAYSELMTSLSGLVPGLTLLTFEGRARSSRSRSLENGQVARFPVITLYLRYDEDRCLAGLDAEQHNWDDSWPGTRSIRERANTILRRHGFPADDISERAFVFVRSLEPIAFNRIGRAAKEQVGRLIRRQTGLEPSHLFWSSQGIYYAVWKDRSTCRRIGWWARRSIAREVPRLIACLDPDRHCQVHAVRVEYVYIGQKGVSLYGLSRED